MTKRKTSLDSEDEEEYIASPKKKKTTRKVDKRLRRTASATPSNTNTTTIINTNLNTSKRGKDWETPLYVYLAELDIGSSEDPDDFEQMIASSVPGYLDVREGMLRELVEVNQLGQRVRPITILEGRGLMRLLREMIEVEDTPIKRLMLRKLLLDQRRRLLAIPSPNLTFPTPQTFKAPSDPSQTSQPPQSQAQNQSGPDPAVLKALKSIRTTPYDMSLAGRIAGSSSVSLRAAEKGFGDGEGHGYLLRDWETRTTWMDLMDDVHEHHSILYPDREQARRPAASIDYQSLRAVHLSQVHDLLTRVFFPGIYVSDSLEYSPEKCTVVATYRHLVVGVAILSSPQETYLTYLAVRAGWENAGIATKMLYTLIARNPGRDILLHVSANNSAMLLYNRFGFKAEEFIVGFYEDYLDSQSRGSKNAFRLRLRR